MSITEKVLRSGIIDRHTAELMSKYGMITPQQAELAHDEFALATKDQMKKLAEELAVEVEREHKLRETSLDLDRLRWPASVQIVAARAKFDRTPFIGCLIDRMGRYYFRIQDVERDWFVPGYVLIRAIPGETGETSASISREMITEAEPLYIGEKVVCIQVSTVPA